MKQKALAIVEKLSPESTLLPVQILGELYSVLVGKAGRSRSKAREAVLHSDAGCRLLLSEDLQEGFTWSGVTVANPFAPARHALLDAVLSIHS
jgi:predicted nucleic acid-binding protein